MYGGRHSVLHYGPLATNNLYAPTPNGNIPVRIRVRRYINKPTPPRQPSLPPNADNQDL